MPAAIRIFGYCVAAVGIVALAGCQDAHPSIGIGDPAVFTTTHIAMADASYVLAFPGKSGESGLSAMPYMRRYFESADDDASRCKLDTMLDGAQRRAFFAQALARTTAIEARIDPPQVSGATEPSGVPKISADDLRTMVTSVIQDSPFDRLDRVYDFYWSYILKYLLMFGHDSRVLDVTKLAFGHSSDCIGPLMEREGKYATALNTARKGLVALIRDKQPTEIATGIDDLREAGNVTPLPEPTLLLDANLSRMEQELESAELGLARVHSLLDQPIGAGRDPLAALRWVDGAIAQSNSRMWTLEQLRSQCEQLDSKSGQNVRRVLLVVFQVHVDPRAVANSAAGIRLSIKNLEPRQGPDEVKVVLLLPQRTYDVDSGAMVDEVLDALSVSVAAGQPGLAAGIRTDARRQTEERRRFLARVSKIGSFADATTHTFGWDFYPSNTLVEPRPYLGRVTDLFTLRPPREYQVNSYLEGGGRLCGAYIVVPKDLRAVTFSVKQVYKRLDEEFWHPAGRNDGEFVLSLPPWDEHEAQAMFFSAPAVPTPRTPRAETSHGVAR